MSSIEPGQSQDAQPTIPEFLTELSSRLMPSVSAEGRAMLVRSACEEMGVLRAGMTDEERHDPYAHGFKLERSRVIARTII